MYSQTHSQQGVSRFKYEAITNRTGSISASYLKVYDCDALSLSKVEAVLLYYLENAFRNKKVHKGSENSLYYVDYSISKLEKELGYCFGKHKIKSALIGLSEKGFTNLGERVHYRKGRKITRGSNYRFNQERGSTLLLNARILRQYGWDAAIIYSIIQSHCKTYNSKVKTNQETRAAYDIVSSKRLTKLALVYMTEPRLKKARASLINSYELFKTRSLNLVNGRPITNEWVYSTSSSALKTYSKGKYKNFMFLDSELMQVNELGITLREATFLFNGCDTHSSKNRTLRSNLQRSYEMDGSFVDASHVDNSILNGDYDSYRELRKIEYDVRKIMVEDYYPNVQMNSGRIPGTQEIVSIVQSKGGTPEHAHHIERLIRENYVKDGRLTLNNYTAFIVSVLEKIKKGKQMQNESEPAWMGSPSPNPSYEQLEPTAPERHISEEQRQENIRLMDEYMKKYKK